jgi:hypothetical protein
MFAPPRSLESPVMGIWRSVYRGWSNLWSRLALCVRYNELHRIGGPRMPDSL